MVICFLPKEQGLCVQNSQSVWDRKFLVLEKMKHYIQYDYYQYVVDVRMAGDGLEEPPVQPGMHVKIKLNDKEEITHIILDDQHKFQQIEAMEVKQCDIQRRLVCRRCNGLS